MAGLDIICIGAINYDYMFHCTGLDLVETSAGGGDENLSNPISDTESIPCGRTEDGVFFDIVHTYRNTQHRS